MFCWSIMHIIGNLLYTVGILGSLKSICLEWEGLKEASHHITYDLLSGILLSVDGSVQLTEHKDAELFILQQPAYFFQVEPANSLTVQNTLHNFLQELLVLTESNRIAVKNNTN